MMGKFSESRVQCHAWPSTGAYRLAVLVITHSLHARHGPDAGIRAYAHWMDAKVSKCDVMALVPVAANAPLLPLEHPPAEGSFQYFTAELICSLSSFFYLFF